MREVFWFGVCHVEDDHMRCGEGTAFARWRGSVASN